MDTYLEQKQKGKTMSFTLQETQKARNVHINML